MIFVEIKQRLQSSTATLTKKYTVSSDTEAVKEIHIVLRSGAF